ncbi:MAG: phytanoyl-CoA dioxygenase [Cellvibrio sp. 79]|nr:MAG: phytanoyl-CoA dioxygenase [Cellvibrio sp. 79]
MSHPLIPLVTGLLECTGAGPAKPVVDQLVKKLCEITGVDLHPAQFLDEGASVTANGKAVSPTTAAQCAKDVERTRIFIHGVYAALQQKLAASTTEPVRVLYAGTGPFGLLLVPLLPLFAEQHLRVTLLDIHAESLEFLQRLLVSLQLEKSELIEEIVCADACNWQASRKYDVIISETMRQGLLQEPQVSIFAHLQQFLKPDGWLLPRHIRLDLWLTNPGSSEKAPHHIGNIFQLDKMTAARIGSGDMTSLRGSLSISEESIGWRDLKLTTEICVIDELYLRENQSQLTLPIYEKNIRIKPDSMLQYHYEQSTYPRFVFEYEQEPDIDELPLPDVREKSSLGLYHLLRFWHKVQLGKSLSSEKAKQQRDRFADNEWELDRILLYKLGMGLEPAIAQIYQASNIAEFEHWIEFNHGGSLDSLIIESTNSALVDCLENKKSILLNDAPVLTEAQLSHWDEQGYLIIPGILSSQEAAAARTAIWDYLQMHEGDVASWYKPSGEMKKIMVQLFAHPAFEVARQSPYVRAIFQQLWQREDLVVITDRVGFNPPETPQWQFPGPSIHWDVELQAPVPFGTQALIYLTDVAEHQGAFCCVPGFHKEIDHWLAQQPKDIDLQKQDWSQWPVKPIAANAGDLIIWHQALPHGSSPNRANFPRMVQYINMYAA